MTYYESAEDIIITLARALQEVRKHHRNEDEFIEDMGKLETYNPQEVLAWLGY